MVVAVPSVVVVVFSAVGTLVWVLMYNSSYIVVKRVALLVKVTLSNNTCVMAVKNVDEVTAEEDVMRMVCALSRFSFANPASWVCWGNILFNMA